VVFLLGFSYVHVLAPFVLELAFVDCISDSLVDDDRHVDCKDEEDKEDDLPAA